MWLKKSLKNYKFRVHHPWLNQSAIFLTIAPCNKHKVIKICCLNENGAYFNE